MPKPEPSTLNANELLTIISSAKALENREAHTYRCKLVTPMFGGGVTAGDVDQEMPIRATTIRGQLRFWWRLMMSNQTIYKNTEDLFKKEREIWGGLGDEKTLAASKVTVVVKNHTITTLSAKTSSTLPESYVLYPAQGKGRNGSEEEPKLLGQQGYSFEISISWLKGALTAADTTSVLDAMRWLASFGGIGARARRGTGALEVKTGDNHFIRPVSIEEADAAGCQLKLFSTYPDAIAAWHEGIKLFNTFRQGQNVGRNPPSEKKGGNKSPAGRSRWPEPDAIRKLTGTHSARHIPAANTEIAFPRAEFGLPIIFRFMGEGEGEPKNATLEPAGEEHKRMASPLIIRPYKAGKTKWAVAFLKLPTTHLKNLTLQVNCEGKNGKIEKQMTLHDSLTRAKNFHPLKEYPAASAIDSFLKFVGTKLIPANIETAQQFSGKVDYNKPAKSLSFSDPKHGTFSVAGDALESLLQQHSRDIQEKIRINKFVKFNVFVENDTITKLELKK